MHKASVNNLLRIDLSDRKPDEIAEYLQALLFVRYNLQKKGLKVNIERRQRPLIKINPV